MERAVRPFLVPEQHPLYTILNNLFSSRITSNRTTFEEAGFYILDSRPRSFIHVARHPLLPGHLIKVYFDDDPRKKQNLSSWKWLVRRCVGAEKVRRAIVTYHASHFTVATKYIYRFPASTENHPACLLVTDMNLVSPAENRRAWKEKISRKHLEELYWIITAAKGSSYRPDNIAYTRDGKFAFIDTEYPGLGPDYHSIRPYLSRDMRLQWDEIVRKYSP